MSLKYALNGVFSVYKPKGWTSRKATDFVQHGLSNELWTHPSPMRQRDRLKVGHGGTLDPMAEGVLDMATMSILPLIRSARMLYIVLGVGKGCKQLADYLEGTKEYIVGAKFGQSTDTFDAEGTVIQIGKTEHLTRALIEKTLPQFQGHVTQVPPIYSALKMNGKKLYDYARQGVPLPKPIEPRKVFIDRIELVDWNRDHTECTLRVVCGGGTYMRSIVHDMAIRMGTYAHMTALQRTQQGQFTVQDAMKLDATLSVDSVMAKLMQL